MIELLNPYFNYFNWRIICKHPIMCQRSPFICLVHERHFGRLKNSWIFSLLCMTLTYHPSKSYSVKLCYPSPLMFLVCFGFFLCFSLISILYNLYAYKIFEYLKLKYFNEITLGIRKVWFCSEISAHLLLIWVINILICCFILFIDWIFFICQILHIFL